MDRSKRSLFAQFRCGILKLRVESGRFSRLIESERICQFCNMNEIENELHFIFHRPLYSAERERIISPHIQNIVDSDVEKLTFLMQNKWRVLSNFI